MSMMTKLNIEKRVWLLSFVLLSCIILITAFDIYEYRQNLQAGKIDKLQSVVDIAISVIDEEHERFKNGEITEQQAQENAKNIIKQLRYQGKEYYWIHNTNNVMVMHPIKPSLNGKNVAGVKDPNGKALFVEMTNLVNRKGTGEVEYYWPKPGSEEAVPKLSNVKKSKHWNWIVGSGVYIDDVEHEFTSTISKRITFLVLLLVASFFIVYRIVGSIVRPIKKTTLAMNNIASGDGDLTQRLKSKGDDELALLSRAFNKFAENVQQVILRMNNNGDQVVSQTQHLEEVTERSSNLLNDHKKETEQVATAVYEMSATINEVAQNAAEASQSVQNVKQKASSAQNVVQQSIASINSLASSVDQASETIKALAEETENIGSILDAIRGIAEQTNLLALNAAIEAARAGEQGRGFAVVADEVRSLAKRTQDATEEIQTMIEQLQQGANSAVTVISNGNSVAQASVEKSGVVGEVLTEITSDINSVSDMNLQIASATEQQSATVELINKNVDNINHAFTETAETSRQVEHASSELKAVADDMHELIKTFKV